MSKKTLEFTVNKNITFDYLSTKAFLASFSDKWNILESDITSEMESFSLFRWVYWLPNNRYMTRCIIRIGKWRHDKKNKYFMTLSKSSRIQALKKFNSVEDLQRELIQSIANIDKSYKDTDWTKKYPDFKRFGIRPTEMEFEQMSLDEKAEHPHIHWHD